MQQVKDNLKLAMEWLERTERQILPYEEEAWTLVVQIENAKRRLNERQKMAAHGHLEMNAQEAAINEINNELTDLNRQLSELGKDKPTAIEHRARLLAMYEEKGGAGRRGALAELASELKIDRGNLGKRIKQARKEKAEKNSAGVLSEIAGQLVKDGKRQH